MRVAFLRFCTACLLLLAMITVITLLPVSGVACCIIALALYVLLIEWPAFHAGALTPLYPVLPFFCILTLNAALYRSELAWLVVITATHDTAAYIVGRWWGVHKIAPAISPGKSWEGAFAGAIVSLIVSYCFVISIVPDSMPAQWSWILYSILVVGLNIAGVLGDFFESYLKRRVGIKDSGTLLPGHGGILDRIDSILFVATCWKGIRMFLIE